MKFTVQDFYSDPLITIYEAIIGALIISTYTLIGIYSELFIPVIVQVIVVILLVCYKIFKSQTENKIKADIELNEGSNEDEALIEKTKNDHYKKNKIPLKINAYGYASILLLFFSLVLVYQFPYNEEKVKKEQNNTQYQILNNKIDSLNLSILSLKDSLNNLMKYNQAMQIGKQLQGMDSTQDYNSKVISHKNIK